MSNNDAILGQYATSDSLVARRDLYTYVTGTSLTDEMFARLDGFSGMLFLDVGCGYGADVATVLEKFPDAQCTGIDQSEGMIANARPRAPNATFSVDNAQTFSLDARFDRVLMRHALHLATDVQTTIDNVLRHLAPKGRAVFVVHSLSSLPRFAEWRRWFAEHTGITYTSPGDACTVENDAHRFTGEGQMVTVEKISAIIRLTNAEPILSYIRSQKRWSRSPTDAELHMLLNHVREEITAEIAVHGYFEETSVNGIIVVTCS